MMLPGPGKRKSKSDMPCKPGKQCAATGTGSKVEGASKVSMKDKQKERLRATATREKEDEEYDRKNKGKIVPKFKTNAQYRDGGKIGKTYNKNNRSASDSDYYHR